MLQCTLRNQFQLVSLPPYSPDINVIENASGSAKFKLLYGKCGLATDIELDSLVNSIGGTLVGILVIVELS